MRAGEGARRARARGGGSPAARGSAAASAAAADGKPPAAAREDYDGFSSVYRLAGADGKQRQWFIFDHALVLPEYLVEFDYSLQHQRAEREPSAAQLAELGAGRPRRRRRQGRRPERRRRR